MIEWARNKLCSFKAMEILVFSLAYFDLAHPSWFSGGGSVLVPCTRLKWSGRHLPVKDFSWAQSNILHEKRREESISGKELEAKVRRNQILHQANENEMISMVYTAKMGKQMGVTIGMPVRALKKQQAHGSIFLLCDIWYILLGLGWQLMLLLRNGQVHSSLMQPIPQYGILCRILHICSTRSTLYPSLCYFLHRESDLCELPWFLVSDEAWAMEALSDGQ